MYSAMAIFIFILLLMAAFFTSYIMQERKIQAVHETVVSIFAGKDAIPTSAMAILPLTDLCQVWSLVSLSESPAATTSKAC